VDSIDLRRRKASLGSDAKLVPDSRRDDNLSIESVEKVELTDLM